MTDQVIRVVRGAPSDSELAVLTAVLVGSVRREPGTARAPDPTATRSVWAAPAHRLRTPLHAAPGTWRASTLPR